MSDFWMFSLIFFLFIGGVAGFLSLALAAVHAMLEGRLNRANVFFMVVGLLMAWLNFAGLAALEDEGQIKSGQCITIQEATQ